MLDINGDDLTQARNFGHEGLHGGRQQVVQESRVERVLLMPQPAITWHGALDIKAVGLALIEHGQKAQIKHEQGMRKQKAAQVRDVGVAFTEFEEQDFEVGGLRMRFGSGPSAVRSAGKNQAPIEQGKKAALALPTRD